MSIIDELKTILEKHPSVQYEYKDGWFSTIHEEGGFPAQLTTSDHGTMVFWGGWHEEFNNTEEAIKCFMTGLTSQSRLKVYFRGTCEYKWQAEFIYKNQWTNVGTTSLIFIPFWRKKRTEYLQNNTIEKPQP